MSLLLHLPMMAGMVITAIATCALLLLERSGFRPLELAIGGLVAVIGACHLAELVIQPVAWSRLFASQWPPVLVGTLAGRMVMEGFAGFRMPVWWWRSASTRRRHWCLAR